jgi:hypothetical protein
VTTPPTTTFEDLMKNQSQLIRKPLEGAVFLAPDDATVPTALTGGANGEPLVLPPEYVPIGWVSKADGATWPRSTDTSEVESWGSVEPTRVDITKETLGVKFTAQETNKATLELYEGVDLSTVIADPVTGEITFDRPSRPKIRYYRVLGMFADGSGADTIYVGKLLTRSNVTEKEDQKWTDGDDPVTYGVTLNGNYDSAIGTACRYYFGGPGWRDLLEDMGFPAIPVIP